MIAKEFSWIGFCFLLAASADVNQINSVKIMECKLSLMYCTSNKFKKKKNRFDERQYKFETVYRHNTKRDKRYSFDL